MTKLIKVADNTHNELMQLKNKMECKSVDEVIIKLLEINTIYSNAKIVRVIE